MAKIKWGTELKIIPAIFNKIAGLVLPKYGETTFFSISVASIIFFILNGSFRKILLGLLAFPFQSVLAVVTANDLPLIVVCYGFLAFLFPVAVVLCYLIGFGVSTYDNLAQKKFNRKQNFFALVFALVTGIVIGISSHFINLNHDAAPGMEFYAPIMGLVLLDSLILTFLLLSKNGYNMTEYFIIGGQMDKKSIISSALVSAAIYLTGTYLLRIFWPVTFFLCVYYATRISTIFKPGKIIFKDAAPVGGL